MVSWDWNLKISPHRTSSVNCPLPMQSNARAFPGDLTSPNTHAKRGCLRLPLLVSRLHAITASCVADRQQTGLCLHEGCVHPAAGLPSSLSASSDEWIPASKLIEGVVPTSADFFTFCPLRPPPFPSLCFWPNQCVVFVWWQRRCQLALASIPSFFELSDASLSREPTLIAKRDVDKAQQYERREGSVFSNSDHSVNQWVGGKQPYFSQVSLIHVKKNLFHLQKTLHLLQIFVHNYLYFPTFFSGKQYK